MKSLTEYRKEWKEKRGKGENKSQKEDEVGEDYLLLQKGTDIPVLSISDQ